MNFAAVVAFGFVFYGIQDVCAQGFVDDFAVSCFDNLITLNYFLEMRENAFEVVDYILCPNTVFDLRESGGDEPILVRKNTRILCGADGKRSNDCRLHGGRMQLASWSHTYMERTKENVFVSGVTFDNAELASAVFVSQGDIHFVDCLFINHQNDGALTFLYTSDADAEAREEGNRKLVELEAEPDVDKKHQGIVNYYTHILEDRGAMDDYKERAQQRSMKMVAERDVFVATFEDCLFEQNSSGKNNDVTTNHGVISLVTPSNRLIVKDSVFHGNYFGDEDITPASYCIDAVEMAEIELENNCFLLNDLNGLGTVNVKYAEQILIAKNNFGTFDDQLDCQFIHIESGETSCIDYDAKSCPVDFAFGTEAPAPPPTPTQNPVSGPILPSPPSPGSGTLATVGGLISIGALAYFCAGR